MRLRLRFVILVPVVVAAVAWGVMWAMLHLAHHSVDDTDYWGAAVSWLVNAAWYAGVTCSVVAVLVVLPGVLLWRGLRMPIARDDAKPARAAGPDAEQQRWRQTRLPRV